MNVLPHVELVSICDVIHHCRNRIIGTIVGMLAATNMLTMSSCFCTVRMTTVVVIMIVSVVLSKNRAGKQGQCQDKNERGKTGKYFHAMSLFGRFLKPVQK